MDIQKEKIATELVIAQFSSNPDQIIKHSIEAFNLLSRNEQLVISSELRRAILQNYIEPSIWNSVISAMSIPKEL